MASTSSSGPGGTAGARPPAAIDRSAVAGQPLFEGLEPAELDRVAALAKPRRVKKGEALFREGEAPHGMFLILDGRLKASRVTPDGQQLVMRFAGPGDLVGHVAVL